MKMRYQLAAAMLHMILDQIGVSPLLKLVRAVMAYDLRNTKSNTLQIETMFEKFDALEASVLPAYKGLSGGQWELPPEFIPDFDDPLDYLDTRDRREEQQAHEHLTKKPTSHYRTSAAGYGIRWELALTKSLVRLTPGQANAIAEDFPQTDAVITLVQGELVITLRPSK